MMSNFGIEGSEVETIAKNAIETMDGLFDLDSDKRSFDETVQIIKNLYK